jgi:hypothetical protein
MEWFDSLAGTNRSFDRESLSVALTINKQRARVRRATGRSLTETTYARQQSSTLQAKPRHLSLDWRLGYIRPSVTSIKGLSIDSLSRQ